MSGGNLDLLSESKRRTLWIVSAIAAYDGVETLRDAGQEANAERRQAGG